MNFQSNESTPLHHAARQMIGKVEELSGQKAFSGRGLRRTGAAGIGEESAAGVKFSRQLANGAAPSLGIFDLPSTRSW
jgi:hypothetical protein